MRLATKFDRVGHLLLLDEGPEGIIYCLCPSHFAPDTRLQPGCNLLPQRGARYDSFVVTGKPGQKHLLEFLARGRSASLQRLGLELYSTPHFKLTRIVQIAFQLDSSKSEHRL